MTGSDYLVEQLRDIASVCDAALMDMDYRPAQRLGRRAADRIETQDRRIAKLEDAMRWAMEDLGTSTLSYRILRDALG